MDNYHARGRKEAEWHLPCLSEDIKKIVDCNSQTDPSFKTKRLYTRLSARQVREELISQYNYQEQELPCAETIRQKLNQLGYYPQRVAKTQPQKKFSRPMKFLSNCVPANYSTGVKLTKQEMKEIESQILRLPHLPNWFVDIFPAAG